jgi:uncharacterized protein (UPF0335 family)
MSDAVDTSTLSKFAKRLINLDDQLDDLKEQIKEVKAEAKAEGLEVKHLVKVVAERKKDRDSIEQEEEVLRLYRDALQGKI